MSLAWCNCVRASDDKWNHFRKLQPATAFGYCRGTKCQLHGWPKTRIDSFLAHLVIAEKPQPWGAQCSKHKMTRGNVSPSALCTVMQYASSRSKAVCKPRAVHSDRMCTTSNQQPKLTTTECLYNAKMIPIAPLHSPRSTSKFLVIMTFVPKRSHCHLVHTAPSSSTSHTGTVATQSSPKRLMAISFTRKHHCIR